MQRGLYIDEAQTALDIFRFPVSLWWIIKAKEWDHKNLIFATALQPHHIPLYKKFIAENPLGFIIMTWQIEDVANIYLDFISQINGQ